MIKLIKSSIPKEKLKSFDKSFNTLQSNPPAFFSLAKKLSDFEVIKPQLDKHFLGIEELCLIGMGGSSLGPKTINTFSSNNKNVHFFDNLDQHKITSFFNGKRDFEKIKWVVTSKSGGTLEVISLVNVIDKKYNDMGLCFKNYSIVISESKSNLITDWASGNNVTIFELPKEIGGRYSVLSNVGLIPAYFLGCSVKNILSGAQWSLDNLELAKNFCQLANFGLDQEKYNTVFWFYSDRLNSISDWLVQLWSESLGKSKNLKGGEAARVSQMLCFRGASDHHSILQQVLEGAADKLIVFVKLKEDSADKLQKCIMGSDLGINGKNISEILNIQCEAAYLACVNEGIPCVMLEVEDISDKSLGSLFMFFQCIVAGFGQFLNIDAFDQPAVEKVKTITKQLLRPSD